MKIPWLPIIGAIAAVALVKFVGRHLGMTASLVTLGTLMLAWWGMHLFYKQRIRQIHAQLETLDEARKAEVLAELDPEIRKELERVAPQKKNA